LNLWVEVSEEKLIGNFRVLQRELADASTASDAPALLAVVKANAYGHGARVCAPMLARAGVEWLGVTDAAEGLAVSEACRDTGVPRPQVLVMSGLARDEAPGIVADGLTPVLWNVEQLEWLTAAAAQADAPVPVHVEIDTGMGRQGALPGPELANVLNRIAAEPRIRLDGVFTHFASTEVAEAAQTREQRLRFEHALDQAQAAGARPRWVHAGNSSTIDNAAGGDIAWVAAMAARMGAHAMVRSGLALYGYCLPIEAATLHDRGRVADRLRGVMTWKTRVMALRDLAAGATVGYNGTFVASQAMRLAVLPVGYADGLRRELSSSTIHPGGWVMLRGQRAPIIGRVSMNLTMVDVTAIPDAAVGGEVTLLGEGITAEDHARLAGTIPYEILCGVRQR
jgi:alanine racemase